MYFVAVACFFNIVLDFIFIGYFNMHAVGAAFGTVISQLISVIVALFAIIKRKLIVIHRYHLKLHKKIIKDIFKIGFPISMQDGLIQVSFIIITIIANMRGVDIAAAVGVVEKIISFLFLVPSSMLSAISAICAQCVGTKQHQRARQTLRYGCFIALGFGVFFEITCQFISKEIFSLFTSEAIVIMYGSQYLKGYVLDCMFASIHFCFSGFFTAYGYSMISFIHNVISIVLIRVPGAYITSKLFPDTLLPMGLTPALFSSCNVRLTHAKKKVCIDPLALLYRKFGKTFINQLRHLALFPNFCRVKRLLQYLTLNTFVSIQRVKCFIAVCTNPIGFFQQHIFPKQQSNFIRHLNDHVLCIIRVIIPKIDFLHSNFLQFRCLS